MKDNGDEKSELRVTELHVIRVKKYPYHVQSAKAITHTMLLFTQEHNLLIRRMVAKIGMRLLKISRSRVGTVIRRFSHHATNTLFCACSLVMNKCSHAIFFTGYFSPPRLNTKQPYRFFPIGKNSLPSYPFRLKLSNKG